MSRLLVIMGSGETAPTMVKVHRAVFERTGPGQAVLLDTPYGFQTNCAELTRRTQAYFANSLGRRVLAARWPRDPGPGPERERALALLREARWVFAGPGSPTYALRQWRDTPVPAAVAATVGSAGTIVFASAAALTLGAYTVPVYEIYKAGADPHWAPGLDLMGGLTGLPAVVIPHYNNAEGGTHDTRYCYLGEQRLAAMEADLPEGCFILGVDEHTAAVFDLDARTVEVLGTGAVTVRSRGRSRAYPSGAVLEVAEVAAGAGSGGVVAAEVVAGDGGAVQLDQVADRADAAFRAALAGADADRAVAAILGLDQVVEDWAADPSDERDYARSVLRGMVLALGERSRAGLADPRDVLGPYVEMLLTLRDQARERRDFAAADMVRDRLTAGGIEVRDTPAGTRWSLAGP